MNKQIKRLYQEFQDLSDEIAYNRMYLYLLTLQL